MKRVLITILLIILAFAACKKTNDPSNEISIFSSDETKEAADIILDANEDLKKIRAIYKASQAKADELKNAMTNKEVDKVKAIADELVLSINEGSVLGKIAIEKILKAKEMNINPTYKEYLGLKKDALQRQLDAYEIMRKIAQSLGKIYGGKNPKEIDDAQVTFTVMKGEFQKLLDDAKELSQQANQIAKDASKKQ